MTLALLATSISCGYAPVAGQPEDVASGTRAPAPSSPTTNPTAFAPGDCINPPNGGTQTPGMTFVGLAITVPSGWTDLGQPPDMPEIGLLRLRAPASYLDAPTYIDLQGSMGRWPSESPQWVMTNAVPGPSDPRSLQINGCVVGTDPAAFYAYTQNGETGYFVLWLHGPNALEITVHGTGGLDPLAIRDAKQVLGSVTYAGVASSPR